MYLNIMYHTL